MIPFIEFYYANALFLYKRIDGYGERWGAFGATIFWVGGLCMIALNAIQLFTGSLAPIVRAAVFSANKPYDNAAEYLLIVPIALALHYYVLSARSSVLEKKYAFLRTTNRRWLAGASFLFGAIFVVACGYGRVNFLMSLVLAALIMLMQHFLYTYLKNRDLRKSST